MNKVLSKKKLVVVCLCLLSVSFVWAQQNIQGVVKDVSGEPIIGANVVEKGTANGKMTDINGRFAVQLKNSQSLLVVSFIGFITQELIPHEEMEIVLQEDTRILEEVVVTGFGNLRVSQYDGSASVIKTDRLAGIPNQSVASMIQANAPGVSVTSLNSQPGGVETVSIRGFGSFNASNEPLYVIDGIPVMSGDINHTGRGMSIHQEQGGVGGGTSILATLNPNDISNITIIKDAAAASLWGSRAANGVVLITTKQGEKGKMQVIVSSDFGTSDFAYHYRPMMGGEERRRFIYDSYKRKGLYEDNLSEAEAIAYADRMAEADANLTRPEWSVEPWSGWTDWRAEAYKKGSHNNQEISFKGGTDRMTYYSSFSHSKSQGILKSQNLERYTGRVNVTFQANPWFRTGGNLLFSDMEQRLANDGRQYDSAPYAALVKTTPSDPVYNRDGTFNTVFVGPNVYNIAGMYKLNRNTQHVTRAFNTVFMEAQALPSLTLKTTLSYDYTGSKGNNWLHPMVSGTLQQNGTSNKSYREYRQLVWSSNVNYVKSFDDKHNVDALLAYEIMDYYMDFLDGSSQNFVNLDYTEVSNGSVLSGISGYYSQDRMVSYISKVNYNLKYKYYAGGSFRRDGTSRLHSDSRWGNFWSVSAGWRFSEENFMKGLNGLITNGKLRVSYGLNGTRPSGLYAYQSLTSISNSYNGTTALYEGNIANNNMLWENNYTLNTGLDISIAQRIDVTLEFYDRITKNLLMDLPISYTTGFSSYTTNIGSVRNRGVELTVSTSNIRSKDLSWQTHFNLSHNKNKILEMDGTEDADIIINGYVIQRKGLPYFNYYVVEFSHVNPDNGRAMFFLNNELADGTINRELTDEARLATRIPYKSPLPTVTMALTNDFTWKFVDLGFTFSSTLGGYSIDQAAEKTQTSGSGDGLVNQIPTYYRDSWKQPGDNVEYEAWIPGNSSLYRMIDSWNSRRIHSTNHIRLKNLTAGVTLPQEWTDAIKVGSVRVYFAGQNLWTLAAYDDYDPETPPTGRMNYNTPPLKSYSIGININF